MQFPPTTFSTVGRSDNILAPVATWLQFNPTDDPPTWDAVTITISHPDDADDVVTCGRCDSWGNHVSTVYARPLEGFLWRQECQDDIPMHCNTYAGWVAEFAETLSPGLTSHHVLPWHVADFPTQASRFWGTDTCYAIPMMFPCQSGAPGVDADASEWTNNCQESDTPPSPLATSETSFPSSFNVIASGGDAGKLSLLLGVYVQALDGRNQFLMCGHAPVYRQVHGMHLLYRWLDIDFFGYRHGFKGGHVWVMDSRTEIDCTDEIDQRMSNGTWVGPSPFGPTPYSTARQPENSVMPIGDWLQFDPCTHACPYANIAHHKSAAELGTP